MTSSKLQLTEISGSSTVSEEGSSTAVTDISVASSWHFAGHAGVPADLSLIGERPTSWPVSALHGSTANALAAAVNYRALVKGSMPIDGAMGPGVGIGGGLAVPSEDTNMFPMSPEAAAAQDSKDLLAARDSLAVLPAVPDGKLRAQRD